jgi:hypothetical protein
MFCVAEFLVSEPETPVKANGTEWQFELQNQH